ncbi:hypothetical protein DCAR_0726730 [Daucus carota subsp. sativus]|uniref:Uncharacterized protein n=1 Tax=Daucus carota subsp. sativus TaxID=79200 RepID=A0A164SJ34_DAUCS|nr:hypothetical protein DCAR_0726730 [Daucus carota subsp. sativus]
MAREEDKLLKIAMEGFAMLDACPRPNGRRGGLVEARRQNPQNLQTRVYRMTTQAAPSKAGVVINSNEAAKIYGGVVFADYPKKGFFRRLFG